MSSIRRVRAFGKLLPGAEARSFIVASPHLTPSTTSTVKEMIAACCESVVQEAIRSLLVGFSYEFQFAHPLPPQLLLLLLLLFSFSIAIAHT